MDHAGGAPLLLPRDQVAADRPAYACRSRVVGRRFPSTTGDGWYGWQRACLLRLPAQVLSAFQLANFAAAFEQKSKMRALLRVVAGNSSHGLRFGCFLCAGSNSSPYVQPAARCICIQDS